MALTDPLQWVLIAVVVIGLVIVFFGYLLYRLLRVLNKADKYFDARAKESKSQQLR